jgi:hypothetical protein
MRAATRILIGLCASLLLSGCSSLSGPTTQDDSTAVTLRGEWTAHANDGGTIAGAKRVPAPFEDWAWPDDPRIRSAGRLRALYPDRVIAVDPAQEVAQIREHFRAVGELLEANERESIDIAIGRIEKLQGRTFGRAEQREVERELLSARRRQIVVLQAYSRRGRFPLNPEAGAGATPIFVDAHDTACAVGHLMRMDSRVDDVAQIAALDNFVYVPDVRDGPVAEWVSTSGLTIEEAALIQPAYLPPPDGIDVDLQLLAAPGGSVDLPGYRIDAFGIYALPGVVFGTPTIPLINPLPLSDLAGIEMEVFGQGTTYNANGYPFEFLEQTLVWNASAAGGLLQPNPTGLNTARMTSIAFDVTANQPGYGIDLASVYVGYSSWLGEAGGGDEFWVQIEVFDEAGNLLALDLLGEDPNDRRLEYFSPSGVYSVVTDAGSSLGFAPQQKVSVRVHGLDYTGAPGELEPTYWNHFSQTFRVVPIPEPGKGILLGAGLAILAGLRSASRRGRRGDATGRTRSAMSTHAPG